MRLIPLLIVVLLLSCTDREKYHRLLSEAEQQNSNYIPFTTDSAMHGSLEEVAYQVHTHPSVSNEIHNPLLISDENIQMANLRFAGTVHILVLPNSYYKVHTNQLNAYEGPIKWRCL